MRTTAKVLAACLVAALASSGTAYASDAVQAAVTIPAGEPVPIIVENGTTQSQGTYAIGTIQLLYTVEALAFTPGEFAVFNLAMGIETGNNGKATVYPVNGLELRQTGSSNLVLTPQASWFWVGSAAWSTVTPVTISIPEGVSTEDGTTLVGNLQIESPNGSHLGTATTVQVKIKLVHPTACLKLYDFVTDTTLTTEYTSIQVQVNTKKQEIKGMTPGQLSNNVLVVNTCPTAETFDARVALDPYFSTSPSGNPGNAVFTFVSGSEVVPADVATTSWGSGTPQGQNLCLANVTLPGNSSWLATVKMDINRVSSVGFPTSGTFAFSAWLHSAGSACGTTLAATVLPSNPATATVSYTVR